MSANCVFQFREANKINSSSFNLERGVRTSQSVSKNLNSRFFTGRTNLLDNLGDSFLLICTQMCQRASISAFANVKHRLIKWVYVEIHIKPQFSGYNWRYAWNPNC